MASQGTCKWTGASGKIYSYEMCPIGTTFNQVDGNYIYAKSNAPNSWTPIYIGQGNLAERSDLNQHHQGPCIKSKGATRFHCHVNDSAKARLDEEDDLLKNCTDAYQPLGCNEKKGG